MHVLFVEIPIKLASQITQRSYEIIYNTGNNLPPELVYVIWFIEQNSTIAVAKMCKIIEHFQ